MSDTTNSGTSRHAPARPDDLLTVVEVAEYLGVSRTHVQRLIYRDKSLPAVYVAGGTRVLRVRRADVDALLRPVHQ